MLLCWSIFILLPANYYYLAELRRSVYLPVILIIILEQQNFGVNNAC